MSRITDIIKLVREELADKTQSVQRWTDFLFLEYIKEAQRDIAYRLGCLKDSTTIDLFYNVPIYSLPENAIRLTTIKDSEGIDLQIVSHDYMDNIDSNWYFEKGERPLKIVYNLLKRKQFRVYPIPYKEDYEGYKLGYEISVGQNNDDFGIIADSNDVNFDSDFGCVVDLNLDNSQTKKENKYYGVLTSATNFIFDKSVGIVSDSKGKLVFSSPYGFVTGIAKKVNNIIAFYDRMPKDPETLESELEIDDIYDRAIKFYCMGMALRNDVESQDRNLGNEFIQFYEGELRTFRQDSILGYGTRNESTIRYLGEI